MLPRLCSGLMLRPDGQGMPAYHVDARHEGNIVYIHVVGHGLRPIKSCFLCIERCYDDRAGQLVFVSLEHACCFDEHRYAGGIVVGPVVNYGVVAAHLVAEVVVVGTENYVFVTQFGVAARNEADNIGIAVPV